MKFLLSLLLLTSIAPLRADDGAPPTTTTAPAPATYPEIPYYLRQLNEATSDRKRVELNKIIHDAIVNANLSDKHVVKAMEPMIENVRKAISAGLDTAYLEGVSTWLGSAVAYFDREKGQPTLDITEAEWLSSQTSTDNGGRLVATPNKIWLVVKENNILVAESSNIHEAVITPDAKWAAFIRELNDGSRAEVWTVNMKNRVRKKLATVNSCLTLVISLDGDRIFIQEKPAEAKTESTIWSVSFSGGRAKKIGEARLLQTVVGKGRYKNSLVVYKVRPHHLGTTVQECAYAWDQQGHNLGRMKNIPCR